MGGGRQREGFEAVRRGDGGIGGCWLWVGWAVKKEVMG